MISSITRWSAAVNYGHLAIAEAILVSIKVKEKLNIFINLTVAVIVGSVAAFGYAGMNVKIQIITIAAVIYISRRRRTTCYGHIRISKAIIIKIFIKYSSCIFICWPSQIIVNAVASFSGPRVDR
jgi:hypothetical protein